MIKANQSNCISDIKGLGTLGCKIDYNYPTQFGLLEKGASIDLTNDELTQALIDGLVKSRKLQVLPNHNSYTNESEETVYETLPSGAKLPVRNGLYEFMPMYAKGSCFSNALSSLGSKSWTLIIFDLDDNGESRIWGNVSSDNKFTGFDLELVNVENRTFNDGATSTKTPLRLQLSTKGSKRLQSKGKFLSSNNDVDFSEIGGVNDVVLNATNTTSAGFSVSALIGCDGSTPISANLAVTNWKITNTADNADVVPSSITYVNGAYLIAGVPTGTYTVEFFDKTDGTDVVVAGGNYVSSDIITVTLT